MRKNEMTTEQVNEWIRQRQQESALKWEANVYASALMPMFHIIPHGINLVHWLASPQKCRSNDEAVRYWVYEHLKAGAASGEDVTLGDLASRMQHRLDDVESSFAR